MKADILLMYTLQHRVAQD